MSKSIENELSESRWKSDMYESFLCELESESNQELLLRCQSDDVVIAEKYAEAVADMMSYYTGVEWNVVKVS